MNKALENYIKNYDMTDQDIKYKYNHSYRVMNNSEFLAKKLKLDKTNTKLAKIIGLYHDIGRFEQDKRYDSFNDTKTFDHADYGVEVLFKQNIIKQIPVEEKYYHIIEKSIKNHNKYKIEDNLTQEELVHARIIRDADKIDILYSASEKFLASKFLDLTKEKEEIRNEIKKEFYNNKQIKTSALLGKKTESEKIISYLALIFDLNYKESIKYILDNKIIDNFYNNLKGKEKYKKYFDYAKNYLKERVKC